MAEPFLSEIRMMAFPFTPRGWAPCNGQLLPINQYQALFSLLGTTYGGNGSTTFALPNLKGRVPIGTGPGHALGAEGSEGSPLAGANPPRTGAGALMGASLSFFIALQGVYPTRD